MINYLDRIAASMKTITQENLKEEISLIEEIKLETTHPMSLAIFESQITMVRVDT